MANSWLREMPRETFVALLNQKVIKTRCGNHNCEGAESVCVSHFQTHPIGRLCYCEANRYGPNCEYTSQKKAETSDILPLMIACVVFLITGIIVGVLFSILYRKIRPRPIYIKSDANTRVSSDTCFSPMVSRESLAKPLRMKHRHSHAEFLKGLVIRALKEKIFKNSV